MKRLLLVVDFQNDFVDGALGFPGAADLELPIAEKIRGYRSAGDVVAFTRDAHCADYLATQEGKYLPVEHCLEGSAGLEFFGEVAALVEEGDLVFEKPTFGSTKFADFLAARQEAAQEAGEAAFASIEIVGLVSNLCVLANAVIAKTVCPEVPIILDAACTDSYDASLHEKSLDIMEGFQIQVINR
ncbi:MAG: cysteine hydrolase [Eggerthellaceae bacterium]|nr:cysteine hydrolase [Eggerthellaceae bacterium]